MPKGRYSDRHLRRTKVYSQKSKSGRKNHMKDEKRMAMNREVLNGSNK